MIINSIVREAFAGGVALTSRIERHRTDRKPIDFYVRFFGLSPDEVDDSADAFAAAFLVKAMRVNEPLVVVPPISPRLHLMLPRIRDIYHAWWPDLFKPVRIETVPREARDPVPQAGVGTFFSGGVDSFYSLLKHHRNGIENGRPLTHLVFMRGVETSLERGKGVGESEDWVRAVAGELGVRPIFGITNIRSHILTHWEKYDHGSALASVALCLSPSLGVMCIPSAFSYNHLVAHGSSPLTDEMFSSDRMFIFHDGAEVTRAEKVRSIVDWNKQLSLRYLRVCLNNSGGAFNCGKCRKCVRTAIPLQIMGEMEGGSVFQCETTDHWSASLARDHLELLRENLDFARRHAPGSEIAKLLERIVRERRFEQAVGELKSISLDPPA